MMSDSDDNEAVNTEGIFFNYMCGASRGEWYLWK